MWKNFGFVIILAIMTICGVTVYVGDMDEAISFTTVMEVWSDVVRDIDQVGLRVTRVSDAEEMEIGRNLASSIGPLANAPDWQEYVTKVGDAVAQHRTRPGIKYEFHVLDSPLVNAFAIPGGHIFITTGMLDFLESEAELAAILGHEIAHVDLRHCIERLQYVLVLENIGAPQLSQFAVQIVHRLASVGYTKYQELEADAQGVRTSIQQAYDPEAAVSAFQRLPAALLPSSQPRPRTPVDAMANAVIQSLGNYTHSHPPTRDRIDRIEQLINSKRLSGRRWYVGRQNYQQRVPRSDQEFKDEFREE